MLIFVQELFTQGESFSFFLFLILVAPDDPDMWTHHNVSVATLILEQNSNKYFKSKNKNHKTS